MTCLMTLIDFFVKLAGRGYYTMMSRLFLSLTGLTGSLGIPPGE